MRNVTPRLIEMQAEALQGYLSTGGTLNLWLGSKGFNSREKAAILRRFRELDEKRLEPVNPELPF